MPARDVRAVFAAAGAISADSGSAADTDEVALAEFGGSGGDATGELIVGVNLVAARVRELGEFATNSVTEIALWKVVQEIGADCGEVGHLSGEKSATGTCDSK